MKMEELLRKYGSLIHFILDDDLTLEIMDSMDVTKVRDSMNQFNKLFLGSFCATADRYSRKNYLKVSNLDNGIINFNYFYKSEGDVEYPVSSVKFDLNHIVSGNQHLKVSIETNSPSDLDGFFEEYTAASNNFKENISNYLI